MPRMVDADKLHYKTVWITSVDKEGVSHTSPDTVVFAREIDKKSIKTDVEKVIRCKNCQFARCELSVVRYYGAPLLCARTGLLLLDGNGYCSWAELATDRPIEKEEKTDGEI